MDKASPGPETSVALQEIYDPKADKWSTAAPMPTARSSSAFAEYRGLLFFAGGECRTPNIAHGTFDENEAYDLKTGKWRKLVALPAGRHGFAAAAVGNTLYFVGGSTECGARSSNTVRRVGSTPNTRESASSKGERCVRSG